VSGYGADGARGEEPEPIIKDSRKVDPITGKVRDSGPFGGAGPFPGRHAAPDPADPNDAAQPLSVDLSAAELDLARQEAAERTADLQRVTAEYANYRKRVDRDRELTRDSVIAGTLAEFLPVLDDVGRAREHGELEGAFKAVGEALEATVTRLGLESFGAVGEPFDPTVHEALTHAHSDEVTEPTCVAVYQPGYRFAGRVVRPARVGVADPS
jgi:molecular chaperone GrpE